MNHQASLREEVEPPCSEPSRETPSGQWELQLYCISEDYKGKKKKKKDVVRISLFREKTMPCDLQDAVSCVLARA